jgi:hypothetical protein
VTLTLAKAGGWSIGEILTSDQMDHIQSELIKAIDGSGGGSYSPSANVTIGGAAEWRFDNTVRFRTGSDLLTDAGSQSDFSGQVDFFSNVDFRETSTVEFIAGGLVEFHDGTRVVIEELDDLEVDNQNKTMRMHNGWGEATWNSTEPYWEMDDGIWIQLANTSGAAIYFALPVMAGDSIVDMGVTVEGDYGASHGGATPAGLPRIRILEQDGSGDFSVVVAEVTDSTSGAGYAAAHVIVLDNTTTGGDLPYTATNTNYVVEVRGEFNTDSAAGALAMKRLQTTITRRRLVSQNVFGA